MRQHNSTFGSVAGHGGKVFYTTVGELRRIVEWQEGLSREEILEFVARTISMDKHLEVWITSTDIGFAHSGATKFAFTE